MRRYESVVILNPDMVDDEVKGFTEKYTQIVKQQGGEIIKIEDWGSKRLAYPVQKRERGRYILLDYVGKPALLTEVERQFKIADEVMKFISVKIDDNVNLEAFRAKDEPKESAAPAAPADMGLTLTPVASPSEAAPSVEAAPVVAEAAKEAEATAEVAPSVDQSPAPAQESAEAAGPPEAEAPVQEPAPAEAPAQTAQEPAAALAPVAAEAPAPADASAQPAETKPEKEGAV
jgi:small subunit ribosomal protein S6